MGYNEIYKKELGLSIDKYLSNDYSFKISEYKKLMDYGNEYLFIVDIRIKRKYDIFDNKIIRDFIKNIDNEIKGVLSDGDYGLELKYIFMNNNLLLFICYLM